MSKDLFGHKEEFDWDAPEFYKEYSSSEIWWKIFRTGLYGAIAGSVITIIIIGVLLVYSV